MPASDFQCPHFFILSPPREGGKGGCPVLWEGGQRVGCVNDAKLYELCIHNCLPNLPPRSLSPPKLLLTCFSLLLMLSPETTVDPRELDATVKLETDKELWLSKQKTKTFWCPSILGDFQSAVICVPWKWSGVLGSKPPVEINFNFICCWWRIMSTFLWNLGPLSPQQLMYFYCASFHILSLSLLDTTTSKTPSK